MSYIVYRNSKENVSVKEESYAGALSCMPALKFAAGDVVCMEKMMRPLS